MNMSLPLLALALSPWLPIQARAEPTAIPLALKVTYDLIHPLHRVKGVSTNGNFRATFGGDGSLTSLSARIPVADFNSGNDNRDSHALEVVESIRFPQVGFQSARVEKSGTGYRIAGTLQFHGVSREVQATFTPIEAGSSLFTGTFQILLSDFGVPRPALLFLLCEDRLTLKVEGKLTISN